MAENKTKPTDQSVDDFLDGIKDDQKREDSKQLVKLMQEATGEKPVMWSSIVGFGSYHYKGKSSEGDWMKVGFSPRVQALTLYGLIYYDWGKESLAKLGPHTTGKGCLYIKRLSDIDLDVLLQMIRRAHKEVNPFSA